MKSIYNKKKYSIKKPKKPRNPRNPKKAKKTKKSRRCKKKYCQKGCGYKKQNGGYGIHTEMNKISDYVMSYKDDFLGKQYD
tara:strand:+ start:290 stop:532 length:243 start_codon:yes stop_codon:yes gene_type:complete